MALNDLDTVSLSTARTYIKRCLAARVVPLVKSSPGLGKSAMAKQIAAEADLEFIDIRLSQMAPEDLLGLPMKEEVNGRVRAKFTPFDIFPVKGDPLPEGKKGWLILFDELTSASKSVQAAAYRIFLDGEVGQEKLHEKVYVMAAGNLETDRAIVNPMSSALVSRLAHVHVKANYKEWVEWAAKEGIDHRIIGFIEFQPNKLHMFDPEKINVTYPCPRTWEFLSRMIKNVPDLKDMATLIGGTIGPGVATEFVAFSREYHKIPKIHEILSSAKTISLPSELSTRFAVLSLVMAHASADNIADAVTYITRFEPEEQIIFFRSVLKRLPELENEDVVTDAFLNISKYLM